MNCAERHHYLLPNTSLFGQERGFFGNLSIISYVLVFMVKFRTIVLQEQNVSLHTFIYINDPMPKLFRHHHCACFIYA